MRLEIVAIVLAVSPLPAGAQPAKPTDTNASIRLIEDRMGLRALVDTFSLLADRKDVKAQLALFTPNATVETFRDGTSVSKLAGREQIGSAFDAFLKNFDVVYHFNGQHLVSIQGDRASGDLYCMTYLFGKESGKRMKTTLGIRYQDEYVREGGTWLIAKRTSFFEWQEKNELP
jgi:hypothetical protein